jgi:O-glycosyl hydrolase
MRSETFQLNPLQILVLIPLIFLMSCASENNSLSQEPGGDISTQIPTDGEITVNVHEKHQTVHGFGTSGAWWAQDVGGWEHEVRDHIIQLLFDQQEGIGLSIYRYNIGGGDGESIPDKWRRAETFEVVQGEYDWNRDTNAIWILKAAHAAGVEHFVAFAVSPPARMTVSGRTNADAENQSNLPPEMYAQFAQYLVDVTRHLQEDEGIPIGWLSPINEPQWDWLMQSGQEGCHYEPKEVAAMTKELIRAIQENKLNVKISVFEAGEWWNSTQDYIDPLLGDPEIAPYLDHLSIHSYWSNTKDKERLIAYLDKNYPNTAVEMTEWTEMEQGRDVYMDSALVLANIIHEDLTIGRVESWQYWIAVSKYNFHDGLIYVALNDHEITETKRLWTMGNYSRYIRPGFQRIEAKSSLDQVKTTVFQSPDEDQFILVVINNDETKQTLRINGIPSEYGQVAVYETSKENNLKEIFSGSLPSVFSFSSESVTTLVYQK